MVAAERAARALEGEVGIVLGRDGAVSSVGFPVGRLPLAEIAEVVNQRKAMLEVPGAGSCHTVVVPLDGGSPGHLLVARMGEDGFSIDEVSLARSMARVLDLTLGTMKTFESRQQAREEFDRIFMLSRALICTVGFDGYFKQVNPAFERMLGYSTAELLARPFLEFVYEEDRERTTAATDSWLRAREHQLPEPLPLQEWRAALAGVDRAGRSGAAPDLREARRDVTERKQFEDERERREEALRRSQEQLARLYEEFRRIADEQTALRRVATLVARGAPPELVFTAVAEEVATLFGADSTTITRFEPDGETTLMGGFPLRHARCGARGKLDPHSAVTTVQATSRAARRDVDKAKSAGPTEASRRARSAVASPIVVEGRVWGAIAWQRSASGSPGHRARGWPTSPNSSRPPSPTRKAAPNSTPRGRASSPPPTRPAGASSGTCMTAPSSGWSRWRWSCGRRRRRCRPGRRARRPARPRHHRPTGALEELREIARGIHPAILTKGGLRPALRALARRSPSRSTSTCERTRGCPSTSRSAPYYFVAEALTNAAKHAHASAVTVTVEARRR